MSGVSSVALYNVHVGPANPHDSLSVRFFLSLLFHSLTVTLKEHFVKQYINFCKEILKFLKGHRKPNGFAKTPEIYLAKLLVPYHFL